jgi:starch phosphorylase
MQNQAFSVRSHDLSAIELEGFNSLTTLALDIRWSWNHSADAIWDQLDPALFQQTRNPWVLLQTVSSDRLKQVLADPAFTEKLAALLEARRVALETPAWFQVQHAEAPLTKVAYFSMEFMLTEALPIYSGGLGNVAGDQLKAASDLGVPVVGIGLLYQQGYFRQMIDKQGRQQALYPYNDPGQLPIRPLRYANGEWLRLEIALPGYSVWLRAWEVQVGRVRLYLLDSNDAANFPGHRGITSELYGGDVELRLKQELVLGLGGWRLLEALNIEPEVCHLNEGHAGFAVLERAHQFMQTAGVPFSVALSITRAGNHFTTHPAVSAGFDRFSPQLMRQYLGVYAEQKLGIPFEQLLALGRANPADASESFNMAYLAIRASGGINGVSRLHGEVSRRLFQPLFPRWPEAEVPIGYVTNGVHMPSWDSAAADELWTKACGKDRWLKPTHELEQGIRGVSDADLWHLRTAASEALVVYARARLSRQLAVSGSSPQDIEQAAQLFNPHALTLGFARRFASYKRPNLLLRDPERLLRLLTDTQRPVQLILAGKAHPADREGLALIEEWIHFCRQPYVRPHVIFLSDYDMHLAEQLVQGVDVWLNTPRRPWEACGTSGMKVLVNGGLNFSELDGWWAEAYTEQVGWSIGDGQEHSDDSSRDEMEAEELYRKLEEEVIPEFYARHENGLPTTWLKRMRESMATLTPRFSAHRAVREYVDQHYLPAATAYRKRSADMGSQGEGDAARERYLQAQWETLRFGDSKVEDTKEGFLYEVQVFLGNINPQDLQVELYASNPPTRATLSPEMHLSDSSARYSVSMATTRPASDFTARITGRFVGLETPLEAPQILWQR